MEQSNFFSNDWFKSSKIICGLMTGTSLDGIDAALVKFDTDPNGRHKFELLGHHTLPLPEEIRDLILRVIEKKILVSEISFLHYMMPVIYEDAVKEVCKIHNCEVKNLDAVGVHGQTVWHQPEEREIGERKTGSTMQIGSVSALAQKLKTPVAGDFRAADIAQGGQGAPLIPIFDYEFFASESENVITLNIGGISNITVLPVNCEKKELIAFDTGPGNVLIDSFMNYYFNKKFDENGETARSGKLIRELFNKLEQIKFTRKTPPKSTGREKFNMIMVKQLIDQLNGAKYAKEDIIHTLTYFTAWSIAENIRLFADTFSKIIISGGGVKNKFMMELLKQELPDSQIVTSDSLNIPVDAKEAMSFAYLAYRTLGGLPGNIPEVTGAKKEAVLGVVAIG